MIFEERGMEDYDKKTISATQRVEKEKKVRVKRTLKKKEFLYWGNDNDNFLFLYLQYNNS